MLREYVYLDRNRVEDFLSQLEGGVADSIRETESAMGAKVEGGLNVGVAKLGSSISAPGFSQEDMKRTTDVALFERLYRHLEQDGLRRVDDRDDLKFSLLHRGDLLELEGDIAVSGMSKLFKTLGDMQVLAPIMDDAPIEGLDEIRAMFGDELPVRFLLDGDVVAYSFLTPEWLRGDTGDIEDECSALVRVRKTVKRGKRVALRKMAGLDMSVDQIEAMMAGFNLDDAPPELGLSVSPADLIADGPCAIVTVIAIYR